MVKTWQFLYYVLLRKSLTIQVEFFVLFSDGWFLESGTYFTPYFPKLCVDVFGSFENFASVSLYCLYIDERFVCGFGSRLGLTRRCQPSLSECIAAWLFLCCWVTCWHLPMWLTVVNTCLISESSSLLSLHLPCSNVYLCSRLNTDYLTPSTPVWRY